MMKQLLVASLIATGFGLAYAKLPAPDEATKAKAAETAANAAWQAKVDAFQLCKAQDRIVANYAKNAGKNPKPAVTPVAATSAPAISAASAASAAAPAASGTPVAAAAPAAPPPCADPGPFAYNPPEQKPLETSGAHSPAGTAASPPSVRQESAEIAPAPKK